MFGDISFALGGVLAVVQSDADNVGGADRRENTARGHVLVGDLMLTEKITGDRLGITARCESRPSRALMGEVTNVAHERCRLGR